MYRELASVDAFGVSRGPYAGAKRTLSWRALPKGVRERFTRCVHGAELPEPLLRRPSHAHSNQLRDLLLVLCALWIGLWWALALAATTPLRPALWLTTALALGALGFVLLSPLLRSRSTPFGSYLFPLDLVVCHGDSIEITPLGNLRSAGCRRTGDQVWLELRFADTSTVRFACKDEAAAEHAYRRLVLAQEALERLTYNQTLEEAVALDPLFGIRETALWSQPSRASTSPRPVMAALTGALVGSLMWMLATTLADSRAFARAEHSGRYAEYLAAGWSRHHAEAERRAQPPPPPLAAEADALPESSWFPPPADDFRQRADRELSPAQAEKRKELQQKALNAYAEVTAEGRAPHSIGFGQRLAELFEASRTSGEDVLEFRWTYVAPAADQQLCEAYAAQTVAALAKVLARVAPPSVLTVQSVRREPKAQAKTLSIDLEVQVRGQAQRPELYFVVRAFRHGKPVGKPFSLTMPPPRTELTAPRALSLFATSEPTTARELLFARAYDRLYDELYGLFFPGDPRVPL